jgi:hypothetical protein
MKGFKTPLEMCDLGKMQQSHSAAVNYKRFQRFWTEEVEKKGVKKASIAKVIFRTVRTKLIASVFLYTLMLLLTFITPVCMSKKHHQPQFKK